eukprot:snap_masked-scaffold_9-processed-gene-13.89-mRNA-1 protein AED:1.00 eAED:1.00 QI:0/0/0/0/1/1/2/0/98
MIVDLTGLDPIISIKSVYVLFLDNFQEESSYMTVQEFKLKAKKCNFFEEEMEEMLEIYTEEGILKLWEVLFVMKVFINLLLEQIKNCSQIIENILILE